MPMDAGGLDARHLGFPVDGVRVLLGARSGGVDDGVDADEGGGESLGLGEIAGDGGGAPIAEEVRGVLARANEASHVVALVEGAADNLAAEGAGGADDQHGGLAHGGSGGGGRLGAASSATQRRGARAREETRAFLPEAVDIIADACAARDARWAAVAIVTGRG